MSSAKSVKGRIFEPKEVLIDIRLCCDGTWDYCQSQDGRKRIRLILAPIFLVASIVFLVIGATWAKFLSPECGQDISSANFDLSNSTTKRMLHGNTCPGYDWKFQKRPVSRETAGEYKFLFSLPLSPIMSASPSYVGRSNSIDGPIGIAVNGIPIYSPSATNGEDTVALEVENGLYDQCGGYSAPPNIGNNKFSLPITGYYHYRMMGGLQYPNPDTNTSFSYCPEAKLWYNESISGHSPLAGFMADGIPIYGPYTSNSKVPTDLDECGGHSSDAIQFYHYHFQGKYPYSVNCLRGCVDGSFNNKLSSNPCVAGDIQHDYSPLKNLVITYGGDGINHTNWTGPACLLAFGFIFFLPSAIFCLIICCSSKNRDENSKSGMADLEEYDQHTGDNVL